jgi:hypothetical protein
MIIKYDMLLWAMKNNASDLSGCWTDEAAPERFKLIHSKRFVIDFLIVPVSRQTWTSLKKTVVASAVLHGAILASWAWYHFHYGL